MNSVLFIASISFLIWTLMVGTESYGIVTPLKARTVKFDARRALNQVPTGKSSKPNVLYVRPQSSSLTSDATSLQGKECRVTGTWCDCSSRDWTNVPTFSIPNNYTLVDLFNNSISVILNHAFKTCKDIIRLILRRNQIVTLSGRSFADLQKLKYLDLRQNYLFINKTQPIKIFKFMPSLETLQLQGNFNTCNETTTYPDRALSHLNKLTRLEIDGLMETSFGPGFSNMSRLKNVSLFNCQLRSVTNETFENLKKIHMLNISHCQIRQIDANAFVNLTNLWFLDLSGNEDIGIKSLSKVFKSMTRSRIINIRMHAVEPTYSRGVHITQEDAISLPRTLTHLTVSSNNIESIDLDVFESLPENLTYLDAGDNRFRFGAYIKKFHKLYKLKTLILDGLDIVRGIPTKYPNNNTTFDECTDNEDDEIEEEEEENDFTVSLPWKLNKVSLDNAQLRYKLNAFQIHPNNSLRELSMQGNIIPSLTGPWIGFDKLEVLRLRNNDIRMLKVSFCQNLTSLTHLDLGSNGIGYTFKGSRPSFQNVSSLKFLNLSFNAVQGKIWNPNLLHGLDNLEELYLQKNQIWHFDFNISHMTKLRVLNLSDTSLPTLSVSIRNHINTLNDVIVDMSENPILCTCGNLDFLEWMATSPAFNESLRTMRYRCVTDIGMESYITDGYQVVLIYLEEECVDKYILFLASLVGSLLSALFVIGLILHRFRWKLRYLYYAAYLNFKERRVDNQAEEFPFDVFVAYAANDENFVVDCIVPELKKRKLKVLVHGRDFAAGDYIASNIVTAVKESRKTLVVLTHSLIRSAWCNYEIQMANVESAYTGRPVLVFLLKENIPTRQLGKELLSHIRKSTFVPYPEEQANDRIMKMFWDKLVNDLKR